MASFHGLAPGNYNFQVIAANNDVCGQNSQLQFRVCGRSRGDPFYKQDQMGTAAYLAAPECLHFLLIGVVELTFGFVFARMSLSFCYCSARREPMPESSQS